MLNLMDHVPPHNHSEYARKQQAGFKKQQPRIEKLVNSGILSKEGQKVMEYYLAFITNKEPRGDRITLEKARAFLKMVK